MSSYGMTTYIANAWLNAIRGGGAGTSYTAPTTIYAQLHVGAPGASGTAALCAGTVGGTVRVAIAFAAASGGSISITGTAPTFSCTATSVSETLTGVTLWDAASGGNCIWAEQLNTARSWSTGDNYTLSSDQLNLGTLAS